MACPSQWEGFTDDGRQLYIRLRHGRFKVHMSKAAETDIDKTIEFGDAILEINKADDSRIEDKDFMENHELIEITQDVFDWSSVKEIKDNF